MKIETAAVTRVLHLEQCCQKEHCTYRAESLPTQWWTSHQQYHIQSKMNVT